MYPGLYDFDLFLRKITSKDTENYDRIVRGKKLLHTKTFNKMINTIDFAVDDLQPSESSKLIWTKTAALVGHSSKLPTRDTSHLWDNAFAIFQDQKLTNQFVGGMVRWRISIRKDHQWFCARDILKDRFDQETGKPIQVATYWVNDLFILAPAKVKPKGFSIHDLSTKFKPLN